MEVETNKPPKKKWGKKKLGKNRQGYPPQNPQSHPDPKHQVSVVGWGSKGRWRPSGVRPDGEIREICFVGKLLDMWYVYMYVSMWYMVYDV